VTGTWKGCDGRLLGHLSHLRPIAARESARVRGHRRVGRLQPAGAGTGPPLFRHGERPERALR
jgi:hypothetical protein